MECKGVYGGIKWQGIFFLLISKLFLQVNYEQETILFSKLNNYMRQTNAWSKATT